MEAHGGAIRVPRGMRHGRAVSPYRAVPRTTAGRAAGSPQPAPQSINASRSLPGSVPGSEHTHLLPPKAY